MMEQTDNPRGNRPDTEGGHPPEWAGLANPSLLPAPKAKGPASEDPLLWFPAEGEQHADTSEKPTPSRERLMAWIGEARRRGLFWAGVIAGTALVLAVGGYAVWQAASSARPASTPGTMSIESSPAGAVVTIDGQPRGVTPLSLSLPAGRHVIEVTSATARREIQRAVEPGVRIFEHIDLLASPLVGRLYVDSRPAGADVLVDGVPSGVTPIELTEVAPGAHTVTLRRAGMSVDTPVAIEAGVAARIVVPLDGGGGAGAGAGGGGGNAGWMSATAPVTLQVFEQGVLIGTTETGRIMVPSGRHTFQFVNEALGFRATRQVDVAGGGTARVALDLPNGTLSVNAVPWAEVLVDGKPLGETPLANVQLPIGTHELVLRHPQFGEQRRTVTVSLKAPTRLGVDMRK